MYWIYSRGHFEINAQPLIFTYVIVIAILYTIFFGINTLLLKELYFEDDEYYMQYHAIWCIHSKGSVRGQKWVPLVIKDRFQIMEKINSFWVFLLNLNDFLIYRVYSHVKSMFFNFYKKKLSIKCFAVLVLFLSC